MADETVTEPVNTAAPEEQATTPAPEASAATPAPTPSPASMPKPHAPSPAAFAKKTPAAKPRAAAPAAATAAYSEADVKAAEAFGRVDDNGTVFVKDGDAEREVGQFPDVSKEEALALYARRFLDLKAKLDLLATRLASPNIKAREIDESVKLLGEETSEPAVVGDLAALKTQYEELKAAGEAKKTEIAEARKAAQAKAVAERTAIVEKAEALAASLGDNTTSAPPCASTSRRPRRCGSASPSPVPPSTRLAASGLRLATTSARPPRKPRKRLSPRPMSSRIPPLGVRLPASSTI